MKAPALHAYQLLDDHFGPQHWWPGESSFEVMIGAVLVQNTSWNNVHVAIENLRSRDLLDVHRLAQLSLDELAALIRPAGTFRVKAKRLANLLAWLIQRCDGSLTQLRDTPLAQLREELLAIHGIGPETADAILLYALEMPVLVVDAYTRRIWQRHGWLSRTADYDALQQAAGQGLPVDVALYNQWHALLVAAGKNFCRKQQPRCDVCPLKTLLPPEGVVAEP